METFEEQARERLGEVIGGRWRLEGVLGVGGMAAVYAAREPGGAMAAIKLLHAEMGVRREIRERFLREGYVANSIEHPAVVRALEHGASADDQVFLAMELLQGETLSARIRRHGGLPLHELLDYMDQILDVLAVAHARGVVHRDLKPDNLFVTGDGRIKILDFGLARVHEGLPGDHRTRSGVALGTLPYMAPEQALGRRAEIDGRVDVFALGATAFRILSGRKVHEAESEAELLIAMASRPAPPLQTVAPRLPPDVCMVVDLALAFQRDARYPDARTMQTDVRALRNGQPPAYALSRLTALGDATRVDRPAPSLGPAGLGATAPASGPALGVEPIASIRPASPASPANSAAPQGSRGLPIWAWLLLGGFFFVTGAAAVVAYFLLYGAQETSAEPPRSVPAPAEPAAAAAGPGTALAPELGTPAERASPNGPTRNLARPAPGATSAGAPSSARANTAASAHSVAPSVQTSNLAETAGAEPPASDSAAPAPPAPAPVVEAQPTATEAARASGSLPAPTSVPKKGRKSSR